MRVKIVVPPMGWFAKLADILMIPLMYAISGTFKEIPQRGHRWNNIRLQESDIINLDKSLMIHCLGISSEMHSRWLFLFHIPILGGWKHYIVLEPSIKRKEWHIGYIANDMIGISRIRLIGPVRMLEGHSGGTFFGIDANSYEQIPIKELSRGKIGEGGPFVKERLL